MKRLLLFISIFIFHAISIAQDAVLLKDIKTGSSTSHPQYLTAIGNTVYFTADDGVHGRELWKSDGTPAGTSMVKDIWPGSSGCVPLMLTVFKDTLYFTADDNINGRELWKSDGTESGTYMFLNINANIGSGGYKYSDPHNLIVVGDNLYFIANDGGFDDLGNELYGEELRKTDGTVAGSSLVFDSSPGWTHKALFEFTPFHDTLFFVSGEDLELWKTDGTPSGTKRVIDLYPGYIPLGAGPGHFGFPQHLTVLGDWLYFDATDSVYGRELRKTNGDSLGTFLIKDINLDSTFSAQRFYPDGSNPDQLAAATNILYFNAYQSLYDRELWKTDGTEAGTVLVKDIWNAPGKSSIPQLITSIRGDSIYFSANDGTNGRELWRSDGTETGTMMVKDITPGNSNPNELTMLGDTLYFTAENDISGTELWKSDGTSAGTVLVEDIKSGINNSSYPHELTVAGNRLFFFADDGERGFELWTLNYGCAPGTAVVSDTTICAGNNITLMAYGQGTGSTIQWEQYNGTMWVDAAGSGAASATYVTSSTVSALYRARINCGSSSLYTNEVAINLFPAITLSSIVDTTLGTTYYADIDLTVGGGAAPFTYLWSNGELVEDIDSLVPGVYNITVTDANGCTVQTSISVNTSVGIEDNNPSAANVFIYPNPTNGTVFIEVAYSYKNENNIELSIYNISGQEVYKSFLKPANNYLKEKISLNDLSDGIYYLQLKTEKEVVSKKMILTK